MGCRASWRRRRAAGRAAGGDGGASGAEVPEGIRSIAGGSQKIGGSRSGRGGARRMRNSLANVVSNAGSPINCTPPVAIASAGLSSPASRGRRAGPVVITRSAPGSAPSAAVSRPSTTRACSTIAPKLQLVADGQARGGSGLKGRVQRHDQRIRGQRSRRVGARPARGRPSGRAPAPPPSRSLPVVSA